jgi:hypothetical protein
MADERPIPLMESFDEFGFLTVCDAAESAGADPGMVDQLRAMIVAVGVFDRKMAPHNPGKVHPLKVLDTFSIIGPASESQVFREFGRQADRTRYWRM